MMKSPRQIDLVGAAVVCALVLAALGGPIRSRVMERNRMVAQQRSALLGLAEQEKIESRLAASREESQALRASIAELHRAFPPRKELDSFLTELNGLARATGTDIVRLVPGLAREGKVYSSTAIEVQARASFEDFYRFLWGLDRTTRLSQLETLRISCEASQETCTVQMTLYIFISARGEPT